jgi:hypothetical protein
MGTVGSVSEVSALLQQEVVQADAGRSTTAISPRHDQPNDTLFQLANEYLQPSAAVWQTSAAPSSDANPDQPSLTQDVFTDGLPYEVARLVGSFAKSGRLDSAIALIHELARHNRGDALQL